MPESSLPPGQRAREDFPRFGLAPYANRVPTVPSPWSVELRGDLDMPGSLDLDALADVPRATQTSDFHCVTTWSRCGLRWGGWAFHEVYSRIIEPTMGPGAITLVVLQSLDGYRARLPLEDALRPDVMLADELDGEPLSVEHGAPLRFVAPAHYGYKNAKHLKGIELWIDPRNYRPPGIELIDHPRARVELEERGNGLPGWAYRVLYRPFIGRTIRQFREGLRRSREE